MILIVMGVSGSGKTTIGTLLSSQLGWEFRDGDEFHPADNIAKMQAGIPLQDDDRWPWLNSIRAFMQQRLDAGGHAIIACSALKQVYRDVLLGNDPRVRFIHLEGDMNLIRQRMQERQGHFMKPGLLQSQFETLEPPSHALAVDISLPPGEVAQNIRAALGI